MAAGLVARTRARAFPSRLHDDDRIAAILGIALGISFGTCFATGVLSHLIQEPPAWFHWPPRPAGLYRVTQGVHVVTGIATIPLLFAKLWVVYPKLFRWPPFEGVAHFLERIMLVPLIAGGLFQVFSGLANINLWYPYPFGFRGAHYWVAWITIGALMVHIGAKWSTTRAALSHGYDATPPTARTGEAGLSASLDRRGFLGAVFATSGLLALFTVGQTLRPLERLALLAPRRPNQGPQGFAVNQTAAAAGVTKTAPDPAYRLVVEGDVASPLRLSLDELRQMPQHEASLPIACVEGWSTTQRWRGVRIRDLLDRAGASADAEVMVRSLEKGGPSATALVERGHARDRDTLLALEVAGAPLHLDHGFPARLIGPNRPGTMQTKWVERLVVR